MSEKSRQKENEKIRKEILEELQKGLSQMELYLDEKDILVELDRTEEYTKRLIELVQEYLTPFSEKTFIEALAKSEAVDMINFTKVLQQVVTLMEYAPGAFSAASRMMMAVKADKKIIGLGNKDIITP